MHQMNNQMEKNTENERELRYDVCLNVANLGCG